MVNVTKDQLASMLLDLQTLERKERELELRDEGTPLERSERLAELLLKVYDIQAKPILRDKDGRPISDQHETQEIKGPRHTCGRREEAFNHWKDEKDQDFFREDGSCSYCGSMSSTAFMEYARKGAELGPTDKNYKVYVSGAPHAGKFYFQHLSEEHKHEFIELLNGKKMNIGYPGRFYVTPFFIKFGPPTKVPTDS